MNSTFHTPVLLQEVSDFLHVVAGQRYIDATLGGGGHTQAIIEQGGIVLAIDWDQEAIDYVKEKFQISNLKFQIGKELILAQGNFSDIDTYALENGFENVAGILFDLGISSHHVDAQERGFSFLKDGPLDMRMNKMMGVSAKDLVNGLSKGELTELFRNLGEEHQAAKIAEGIVRAREQKMIYSTVELATIVEQTLGISTNRNPKLRAQINKRVFQALRLAVNGELLNIKEALPKALKLLKNGGRLVVITFHSLEDRIVKQAFVEFQTNSLGTVITTKPITASERETLANVRSRSAKLRVFEKTL